MKKICCLYSNVNTLNEHELANSHLSLPMKNLQLHIIGYIIHVDNPTMIGWTILVEYT